MPKRNTSKHMQQPFTLDLAGEMWEDENTLFQIIGIKESNADYDPNTGGDYVPAWAHDAQAQSQLTGPISADGVPLPGEWEPLPNALPNGWLFYGPGFLPFWVLFVRWNIRH